MQLVETRCWQSRIVPNGGTTGKKYNIQGDIKTLLERDCEVEKVMRFLNDKEILE